MKIGAALSLVETRRGDSDPPPNQLSLTRSLWLDFDGTGYGVSDSITGTLNRDSRLTMLPPTVLGRVSVGGRDQFITRLDDSPRTGRRDPTGELTVSADSRIPGSPSDIPAVGWAHDFHQVTGTLHLPPGWRLLHAAGVDEVPGTWVRHWSLLELFLALVIAIAVWRMYGMRWGAIALVLLVLTFPEEDAPKWSWLIVLPAEALVRVLPEGRVKALFKGARVAALLLVALIALPFVVQHVREGMHPALAQDVGMVGTVSTGSADDQFQLDGKAANEKSEADRGGTGVDLKKAPDLPAQAPASVAVAPLAQVVAPGSGPGAGPRMGAIQRDALRPGGDRADRPRFAAVAGDNPRLALERPRRRDAKASPLLALADREPRPRLGARHAPGHPPLAAVPMDSAALPARLGAGGDRPGLRVRLHAEDGFPRDDLPTSR